MDSLSRESELRFGEKTLSGEMEASVGKRSRKLLASDLNVRKLVYPVESLGQMTPGRQSSLSCGVEATLDSVRVERQMRVREKRVGERLNESYMFISIIRILSQKRHRNQLTRIYICRSEPVL